MRPHAVKLARSLRHSGELWLFCETAVVRLTATRYVIVVFGMLCTEICCRIYSLTCRDLQSNQKIISLWWGVHNEDMSKSISGMQIRIRPQKKADVTDGWWAKAQNPIFIVDPNLHSWQPVGPVELQPRWMKRGLTRSLETWRDIASAEYTLIAVKTNLV